MLIFISFSIAYSLCKKATRNSFVFEDNSHYITRPHGRKVSNFSTCLMSCWRLIGFTNDRFESACCHGFDFALVVRKLTFKNLPCFWKIWPCSPTFLYLFLSIHPPPIFGYLNPLLLLFIINIFLQEALNFFLDYFWSAIIHADKWTKWIWVVLEEVRLVKAVVFPVVMYGCESWTIKKAERWRIDAFELWC